MLVFLVVLTGVSVTLAAALYVEDVASRQQEARFNRITSEAADAVRVRMEGSVATLRATRGIFIDGQEPGRYAFGQFVEALDLTRHYPGIQGIGWARLLHPDEVAAHVDAVRAEGLMDYRIWPSGTRDPTTAIVYIEPLDVRNRVALGFDMYSESVRREAMERARDTGEPSATARVELVQEATGGRQAGFLIYLPVYASRPTTAAERHAAVVGWVYAPFRAGDLVHATLGAALARELDLELFDGPEPTPDAQMYDADGVRYAGVGRSRLVRIEVAGRTWTLRFTAGESFVERWERWLPRVVLATGLVLTALLFWVSREEARALARAESASLRAGFLAEAGRILASSLDYPRTLQQVSLLASSRVADGCVMNVQEPGGVPLWIAGFPDPAFARDAVEGLRASVAPADGQGSAEGLRSDRPQIRNDLGAASEPLFERDPALLSLHRSAGTRHLLTAPLFARGEPLGAITLISVRPALRFGEADVAMVEDLARLVVAAIDTGRLYRRAQHSLRLRDEFLSIASHELKTPLTSLGLQAESLRVQAGRAPPEVIVRKTDSIRRNLERLNRLVATMLDLSRITSGRLELDLEPLELGEVAREVASRFEDEAARAGCELRVEAQEPVTGIWDRLRVDQVLTNLVSNALKYGPGKPVDVRVFARGDRAFLQVHDQGIGIGAEDHDRIFERFERAVSERNYGGFGLGLWIVRRIVEALGGTVTVESAAGSGATFTVELRREPEQQRLQDRGPLEPRVQA